MHTILFCTQDLTPPSLLDLFINHLLYRYFILILDLMITEITIYDLFIDTFETVFTP